MIKYKDANGQEQTESKVFSIANGDGVHNAQISLRDDGRVDFYLDGSLLYTTDNELTPDYEE